MPPWERYQQKPWEKRGSPALANQTLNNGLMFNATPDQTNAVESVLSPQDMEFQTAKVYYDQKTGTNNPSEMIDAHIRYEYGEDATPQVANAQNRKASKMFKDVGEYTGRLIAGASAQMPTLRKEMDQLRTKTINRVVDAFGIEDKRVRESIEATVPMSPFDMANRVWSMVPSDKLQTWGAEQVRKATDIQSEYMSGVPLEESFVNKDWDTVGKDIGTAIAFEAPNLAIQIGMGLISPEASLEMMFTRAAGAKRAEKTEDDSLEERVIAPIATGAIEVGTEKLLGTQRIIDKFAQGKIKSGIANRFKQIITDITGGAISEAGATFGENVVDRISGEEGALHEGVLLSGIVGSVMDFGAGQIMTVGDATRMRKQNSNEQIDAMVGDGTLTAEQGEAVKNPTEELVNEANQAMFEMDEESRKIMAEEAERRQRAAEKPAEAPSKPVALEGEPKVALDEKVAPEARETPLGAQEGWMQEDAEPDVENINRRRSRLTSDLLTPLLTYVKDVSPEAYSRLNRLEYDLHQRKRNYQLESRDFLQEMTDLAKSDTDAFTKLDTALLNENFSEAQQYIGKESISKVRKMLDDAADDMELTGLEIERKGEYFPRRVKDYEGLVEELGAEVRGEIEQAVHEQMKKAEENGYTLNEEEVSKIINNVIAGSYVPVGGKKPRALKRRTIDEVTPDLAQYYYDSAESLMMWINDASDAIETRKFFGKKLKGEGDIVDMNESIGDVVAEITERDGLTPEDQNKLIGGLRARFGYRPTGKLASKYKSLVAMTTLGQVQNALTQFGDATWSFYENGVGRTIVETAKKKKIKMEDLGIEEVAEEFRTPQGLNTAVNTLFKYSGLKKIDRLGKETLVNASIKQYQSQAKQGSFSKDKQDRLDVLFGDNQESVINDLKSGEITDDVKYLAFSTLLDWQPITLSNMPRKYLENPNGRVLYTLKTFTVKQLDNFRVKAADNIVEGIETGNVALAATGMKNLIRIAGLMYLANIPVDLLKDWLSGKDISWTDTMIDNIYKLIGLSRYSVEYATKEGREPSKVLPETIIPPFNFIDLPAKDIQNTIDKIKEGEDIDLMNLESWQMLPFIGRTLYWTVGKGEEKEEKKRK